MWLDFKADISFNQLTQSRFGNIISRVCIENLYLIPSGTGLPSSETPTTETANSWVISSKVIFTLNYRIYTVVGKLNSSVFKLWITFYHFCLELSEAPFLFQNCYHVSRRVCCSIHSFQIASRYCSITTFTSFLNEVFSLFEAMF